LSIGIVFDYLKLSLAGGFYYVFIKKAGFLKWLDNLALVVLLFQHAVASDNQGNKVVII